MMLILFSESLFKTKVNKVSVHTEIPKPTSFTVSSSNKKLPPNSPCLPERLQVHLAAHFSCCCWGKRFSPPFESFPRSRARCYPPSRDWRHFPEKKSPFFNGSFSSLGAARKTRWTSSTNCSPLHVPEQHSTWPGKSDLSGLRDLWPGSPLNDHFRGSVKI